MNRILFTISVLLIVSILMNCNEEPKKGNLLQKEGVEYSPEKDARIQQYNLERQKKLSGNSTPCDTLALKEYILDNYSEGSYLVNSDKTLNYNIPKPAVIYYNKNRSYIFSVVAKSRKGERLIEPRNIVGYDQSFIDLDSTELGTAYFYLTLFECSSGDFNVIWESLIPSHGGFNHIMLKKWKYNNIPFIEANFHYGRGTGHINYNYFLIDGIAKKPHLLMTYEGINFKRTIANVNDDEFPDYYEYIYYDSGDKIIEKDSVSFVWNIKDSVYVNTRNHRQTRPY
jgi:hypothetical protein